MTPVMCAGRAGVLCVGDDSARSEREQPNSERGFPEFAHSVPALCVPCGAKMQRTPHKQDKRRFVRA